MHFLQKQSHYFSNDPRKCGCALTAVLILSRMMKINANFIVNQ